MCTRHKKPPDFQQTLEVSLHDFLFPKVCVHNGWKTKAAHLSVNNFQHYSS